MMIRTLFEDKTIRLCGNNLSELKIFNKRKIYTASAEGVKEAIKDSLKELEVKYNGSSGEIFLYLSNTKDKEIEEVLVDKKKKAKSVVTGRESVLDYVKSLLKIEVAKAKSDKERYIIYDPSVDRENEFYDLKKVEEIFKRSFADKDQAAREFFIWSQHSERLCTKIFLQNRPRLIPFDPGLHLYYFNTYTYPSYRKEESIEQPTVEEKKLFMRYLEHLFPVVEQRSYVFAWIYTSLISRQETFLCLVGAHGVGKTMFMDFISNLHGLENTVRPKDPNAQFNHYLANKSLVIYDEVEIDDRSKETFKRIANKLIQVERKGEDQRDVSNNASIVLATNYHYMLNVEPSDRRFSIPDLSTKRLETVFGDEAGTIYNLVNDERVMKWFYGLLMTTFDNKPDLVGIKGKYRPTKELGSTLSFEKCCIATAPEEIIFAIDTLKKKDMEGGPKYPEIEFEILKEMYKKFYKNNTGRYMRVGKTSLFYSSEVFIQRLIKYKYKGVPVIKFEGTNIINNISKKK